MRLLPARDRQGACVLYARILDGDSLWLALGGTPDGVRLRGPGGPVTLVDDAPGACGRYAVRWRLTDLPGGDDATYTLETVGGAPVRADALPDLAPMRTPPSRDGRWQFDLRLGAGDVLEVTRTARGPAADLLGCRIVDDAVVLDLTDPGTGTGTPTPRLLLIDVDGSEVGAVGVSRHGDRLRAEVRDTDVPGDRGPYWRLALDTGSTTVPVLRSRNDNRAPGRSTVLPLLWSDGPDGADKHAVRFHFHPAGRIQVHRPVDGPGDEPGDEPGDGEAS